MVTTPEGDWHPEADHGGDEGDGADPVAVLPSYLVPIVSRGDRMPAMLKDLIDEAAQILAFTLKAGVPSTQVAGKKLVLSDYWPAMSMYGDGDGPAGGAKLIKGPAADKFRYLWVYDTEAKQVYMWRVSDGDEKVAGSDRQMSQDIMVLQKKGQLNRVTSSEAKAISKAMEKKVDDTLASLRASIEANKDDLERELDVKLRARAGDVVQPLFFKALADIKQQVTPIGFKPFGDAVVGNADWTRQAASHVLGLLWKKHMDEPGIEAWLKKGKFQVDQLGNQDIQFALVDLFYQYADEWLPKMGGSMKEDIELLREITYEFGTIRKWKSGPVVKTPMGWLPQRKEEKPYVPREKLSSPRIWVDERLAGMAEQTWQDHFDGDPAKGGQPTPERKKLHDAIVMKLIGLKRKRRPRAKKMAVMMMGGPGSGKGALLSAMKLELVDAFNSVDPDEIKGMLPEYQKALDPKNTYRKAAKMVHEESSFIAKRVRQELIDREDNIILDGTGSDADKFLAVYDKLNKEGYRTQVLYVKLDDADEAVSRIKNRAERTGRDVPPDFVKEAYAAIKANEGRIEDHVASFMSFDSGNQNKVLRSKS